MDGHDGASTFSKLSALATSLLPARTADVPLPIYVATTWSVAIILALCICFWPIAYRIVTWPLNRGVTTALAAIDDANAGASAAARTARLRLSRGSISASRPAGPGAAGRSVARRT